MYLVAVANFSESAFVAALFAPPMMVVNLFAKKFQLPGYPLTLHIDTRFAESISSLKNFRPIPGAR